MLDQVIAAGMQHQQMKFANQYAAAVLGKVKSIQETMGAEAVKLIDSATATSAQVAEPGQSVPADPNIGQNVDVVV